jgi:hypothetical protein
MIYFVHNEENAIGVGAKPAGDGGVCWNDTGARIHNPTQKLRFVDGHPTLRGHLLFQW